MGQPKYTLYKYVRIGGSWRYCRAALYANRTVKRGIVPVNDKEEKHAEGNYYLFHAGQWIPAGADALKAQRQHHALLFGNSVEYELYSGRSVPKAAVVQPEEMVANARKKVKDEISKYLDDMIASKRPGKSVPMNRNFLNAFVNLMGKEYVDEYNRDDVIKFRNDLLDKGYERKYIDTQMDFVLAFFRHWIKLPIQMERGDRLDYAANPPERYADKEIIAMERTAKVSSTCLSGCIAQPAAVCRKSHISGIRM